jgi:hypothetical protein
MTTIIEALIVPGAGVATKNLRHQLPELIKQFPEIANIHPGSINVLLGKPPHIQTLDIQTWDCITTPIQWWDAGPDRYQTEVFGFLRIEFEYFTRPPSPPACSAAANIASLSCVVTLFGVPRLRPPRLAGCRSRVN